MEESFVKLLMEHRSMLHGFIYALLRDPHLAEDAMQEVAAILWTKFAQFETGSDFGAWARAIAYREVYSLRRKESRAARRFDEECAREIMAAYERRQEDVAATSHRKALRECVGGLATEVQSILNWRYDDGLSSAEIGRKLKRSAQAVDSLVYRTKQALANCVRKRLSIEGEMA